jgi:hypothetical protein
MSTNANYPPRDRSTNSSEGLKAWASSRVRGPLCCRRCGGAVVQALACPFACEEGLLEGGELP